MDQVIPPLQLPDDRLGTYLNICYNILIPIFCLALAGYFAHFSTFHSIIFLILGVIPFIIRVER